MTSARHIKQADAVNVGPLPEVAAMKNPTVAHLPLPALDDLALGLRLANAITAAVYGIRGEKRERR